LSDLYHRSVILVFLISITDRWS